MTATHVQSHRLRPVGPVALALAVSCFAIVGELPCQEISVAELQQRRMRILESVSDGILLLHARPEPKAMEQWGFVQDPSFLYFSGLHELPGAILALDGPPGEAHLFVPPAPVSFGLPVEGLVPEPGSEAADRHGLDSVRSWDQFESWLEARLGDGVRTLYVDEPRRAESPGVPPGLGRVAGHLSLWKTALERRFPTAEVQSAKGLILALRSKKSPAEVGILRRNASATAQALLAVARTIRPGTTQREAESAVVSACLSEGAQGPSFWPWTMAGPNALVDRLVGAFYRYDQGNRVMESGELVRVDIGCAGGLYGADVGRTVPVSGRFSNGQREAWNLLIEGYLAGLEAMAPGVPVSAVRAASRAAVEEAAAGLVTEMGRRAAEVILTGGDGVWHIHGVGIESGEDVLPVLEEGAVIAYEPGFHVGIDAFYLEDMIAITASGSVVLSDGVAYRAAEIETAMARER